MTHILHVPNHNERTSVFRVESDLDFISGPSTVTIGKSFWTLYMYILVALAIVSRQVHCLKS